MPTVTRNKTLNSRLLLGIESGATGSVALLADHDGNILSSANGNPLVLTAHAGAKLQPTLRALLRRLFGRKYAPKDVRKAALCLAGVSFQGNAEATARLGKILRQAGVKAKPLLHPDIHATLAHELRDRPGMIIVAGTGSCAIAKNAKGRIRRAGGWGSLLGDEGSGYAMGLSALRDCVTALDGRAETGSFHAAIARRIRCKTAAQIVQWSGKADKSAIAGLARMVFAQALRGDARALELLENTRRDLLALMRPLHSWLSQQGVLDYSVILTGGTFEHHPEHAEAMSHLIQNTFGLSSIKVSKNSKGLGAIKLASGRYASARRPGARRGIPSTEAIHPKSKFIDTLSSEEIVRIIQEEDIAVPQALLSQRKTLAGAVDVLVKVIENGGRVFYVGAGTSGRLAALDAAELPPTFGVSPRLFQTVLAGGNRSLLHAAEGAEDDKRAARRLMRDKKISAKDAVIGIAASGRTPFVLEAMRLAAIARAKTIGIACNSRTPLEKACDIALIADTGPEIIGGSTRMKAGTATKLLLNTLSTACMIRLGKVHDHWMVGVVPSNAKLKTRAVSIVRGIGRSSERQAHRALELCGWQTQTAALMAARKISAAAAKRILQKTGGRLRPALEHGIQ